MKDAAMPIMELDLAVVAKLKPHFPGRRSELALASIEQGNTAGRIWALGDPPNTVLLWDRGNNVLRPAGPPDGLDDSLGQLVMILQEAVPADGRPWFKLVAPTPEWDAALHRALAGVEFRREEYVLFDYPAALPLPDLPLPPDTELRFINLDFLNDETLEGRDAVRREIEWMWPDLETYGRRGAGVALVTEGRIRGWCTAEYMSDGACGVGIEVAEDERGRGLGTILAAAFLHVARKLAVTPHWECAATNEPSLKLARKLGYRELERTEYQIGRF